MTRSQPSNAGRGQIHSERCAQTAGANHQHAGSFQLSLAGHANFGNDDVTAVARDLFVRKHWEPVVAQAVSLRRWLALAPSFVGPQVINLRYGAAGYRRHDQDRIAIFHWRVGTILVADVFVVEIHVDEIAECVLIVEKVPAQFSVRDGQEIQSLSGRRGFDFDFVLPAGELTQRSWYDDSY